LGRDPGLRHNGSKGTKSKKHGREPLNDATTTDPLPIPIAPADRLLTAAEFRRLADVPPEVEWFANISNHHTRRAYENAVKDFMRFAGIQRPEGIPKRDTRASDRLARRTVRA
jgi:hypothetical protein